MPKRIRLSRAPGWRLPDGGRSVAYPTKWANQFRPRVRTPAGNRRAVEQYRSWLTAQPDLVAAARRELVGRDLACWCASDLACHADVLLKVVNRQVE